ncbi:hypothetical protein ACJMK2_027641 [Sinanodonta woodiana]|uniref:TIR domain-containing protein n=1 Tax=Sinanodonta woodiana TaxID=1069815 RepID=A0ABD3X4K6_SINWO
MDKEEARFRETFTAFPSSFNLEIKELRSKNVLSDEFESVTERIRMYNLLTFLNWRADERDDAYSYNRKALDLDKENMVSLFNRLWMRRDDGYLTEANEELNRLAKLAEANNNLLLIGKAEIAYCYPIFGPSYFLKSKDMLEDVVRKLSDNDINPDTMLLLKLDLGIVYRKLCNFGNMPKEGWEDRNEEECIKRGAELLYEVACSDSSARWRGRCWASLVDILHVTSKGVRLNKYRKEELFPKEIKENNIESLIDMAMETCGEDSHVLKISGKLYRYLKRLDKAEEVLRKSLCKEKTAYAHHHLALVLKQRLKDRLFENKHPNNGNSDRYDRISTCIRHKTFLANDVSQDASGNNVPSQSPTREYDDNSQEMPKTDIITTVSANEKSMSATSETEKSVKSSTREYDGNLQDTNTKQTTRAFAKGFDRVFSIPEDEDKSVQEILYHLDEAIQYGNGWASLEKGIILRQIKKYKQACDTFLLTLKLEGSISAILEVSCYENLGACCRDIAEQETDSERKREREIDAVIYWKKALDKIASKEGKTLNFPKEEWMSYPVLKNMFQHRQPDIATLKALAELGEKLERPAETRSFYREISELGENEAHDPTIICGEIKTLLKENLYEEAAQMLEKRLRENIHISKTFCKLVYLECAFYFVSIGKIENSGEKVRQAFDADIENSTAKLNFDIFFLYDEDTDTDGAISILAKELEDLLSGKFGLRITSNSQNVDAGKQRLAEQTKKMKSSKHIVLIMDTNEEPRSDLEYFIGIAQEIRRNNKSILNIILVDDCTCPLDLNVFPTMHFESTRLKSKDDLVQWIRDFIFHLLSVDDDV